MIMQFSNYQAENIYNDEEPERPATELEAPPAANNRANT